MFFLIASDTEEPNQLRRVRSDSNVLGTPTSALDDGDDQNDEYVQQANEILDEIWRLYNDDEDSWYEESKSKDGFDIVLSKQFPKWGKIFRLIVRETDLHYEEKKLGHF